MQLFANGVSIGEATASGTSVTITTNGTATLLEGANSITATQTLKDQAVDVGNLSTTTDLASAASSALTVTVDTTAPTVAGVSSTKATGAYGVGTTIPITVTFSEPVTVTGTPQLALNAGSGVVATYTGGTGTSTLTFTYTVAAGQNSSNLDYSSTTALALAGGSIQDVAGNAAVLTLPTTGTDGLATRNIVVDTTAPTIAGVSSTKATGTYGAGTTIPITVTFSEPVTVTGTPQLALNAGSGAVATYTGGSGTSTLTFTYTVAAGQNSSDLDYSSNTALALAGGSIHDAAGNAAVLTLPNTGTDGLATQHIVIALTVAGISSTKATGAYGVGTAIPITVTFSEPVTVTGTPQLDLNASSGAVATYTGGTGTSTLTFTYTVAAGQNSSDLDYTSTTALALDGGTIQGATGNAAVLTLPTTGTDGLATRNIVIDTTAPTIAGVSSTKATGTYGAGTAIPITVTFSESVTVTGTPQLALNSGSGAVANYTGGSGTSTLTFTYNVAAGQNSSDLDYSSTTALALAGGSIQDAAGNAAVLTLPNTGTDGLAAQHIVIALTVAGVSSTKATGTYGVGTTIPITVTFSEPVTVTGTPQLDLNASSGAVASYTGGTSTSTLTFTYTVAAGQNSSDLDYTSTTALALDGGSIQGATGNAAVLTLPTTGTDGLATQNIVIDTTTPTVTGVSSTKATGTYGAGTAIPITVTFSESVTVTGTPQLALNSGSGAVANYTGGSGTSTLTFTYNVAAGQNSSDLDYSSTTALALAGGSIQDAAGNAAVLTLPTTGTDGLAAQNIVIALTVTGVSSTKATGAYGVGTAIPITVTFSESVTVTGTPQLDLNTSSGAVATYTGGTGTSTLTFTYTVAAGQNSSDLDYTSTTALALDGGTIQGATGNAAVLTLPTTGTDGLATQNIVIDTTAPTVTGVSSTQTTGTYGAGTAIPITVTFSESVTVTGTPQLALNAGSGAVANYTGGSGTSTLTFTYTVAAGDSSSDLDYTSTTALALNGGSILDAAGNAAVLTLPTIGTDGLATQKITINTQTATASLSGYVYIDAGYLKQRITSSGTCMALQGVVVRLYLQDSQGNSTQVTGSPTMTAADGSYHFTGLAAGDYQIQVVQPVHYVDGWPTVGTVAGVATGTAKQDQIEVQLGAGASGINYNFGERGLVAAAITPEMCLASSPPEAQIVTQVDAPPVVSLASSTSYNTTYKTGGAAVAIAATGATITDTDSTMLAGMTATISSPPDGDSEKLTADTSNTAITSTYANGVLTLSGVADLATYLQVLKTVKYSDTAMSPQAGDRTIQVVANDGIVNSLAATATVTVVLTPMNYTIAADDSLINASEAAATSFTFAAAETGTTYNYTVTSSGGSASDPVTGTGTVTTATQQVTGVNVSTLPDGTLTYSATLTNAAGNSGIAATATAKLDKTAPSGYTIAADQAQINAAAATATSFTFAGAEVGATYNYTVTSSGGSGSAPVAGTGTVTTATQQVTGIDVSGLPNGTLTYSVTLTDPAGNVGIAATATATLQQSLAAVDAALQQSDDWLSS